MSVLQTAADRRAFGRRPTHLHAIVYARGLRPIRCVVKDMSEGGARFELSESFRLPFTIRVVWEGSALEAVCEVRHQRDTTVGAMFIDGQGPKIVNTILGPVPKALAQS